jgi:hypothetical protein
MLKISTFDTGSWWKAIYSSIQHIATIIVVGMFLAVEKYFMKKFRSL